MNGDDAQEGSSRLLAYATIQKAIDKSLDQDTILIWPGIYQESNKEVINFYGKAVTVQSAADAAILESTGDWTVAFHSAETNNSVLQNIVIRNSIEGIRCISSSPAIRNVTVVNNQTGIVAYADSAPLIQNCIFWNNTYDMYHYNSPPYDFNIRFSCVRQSVSGEGNISKNPLFTDPNHPNLALRDYHLRSERGRFMPNYAGAEKGIWALDEETSPCVDAGDPRVNPISERMPNGGRINMGAYGNTYFASMNDWPLQGDINQDGVVNTLDYAQTAQNWLKSMPWYE